MSVQSYIRKDVSGMLLHIDVGVFSRSISIELSSTSTGKLQHLLSDDTGLDELVCTDLGRSLIV